MSAGPNKSRRLKDPRAGPNLECDLATSRRELYCVRQNVDQYLLHIALVSLQRRQLVCNMSFEAQASLFYSPLYDLPQSLVDTYQPGDPR